MKIEDLCTKLRPVFGEKIDKLYFYYSFEKDADRKKRIEQQILFLYKNHIGSILSNGKVLLPPPPSFKASGEYEIGDVIYDGRKVCEFGLREKEFLRHIGIFGITGTGKSNTVFKLIDELILHGKKIFCFDWKKQYRDIFTINPTADILVFGVGNKNIPSFQFNPLIPPNGIDPSQYLEHICHIIGSAYYVGEGVISLLRKAISDLYEQYGVYQSNCKKYPTFQEVLEYVSTMEHKGRSKDWKDSTIRALEAICHGGLSDVVNVQQPTLELSELLKRNVFLELGDLGQSQKIFIIQSLLTYIYYYSMNRGIKEKFMNAIIIEEAHHILRDGGKTIKEPISDVILKEIREFGTSIILVDQNPSLISVPALANNYTTIGMYTKHGSDISALSKAMFLKEDQKEFLGKLPIGHGIVKLAGRVFDPFLVKFPNMNIQKGKITDKHIALHMARKGFLIPLDFNSKKRSNQAKLIGVSQKETNSGQLRLNQAIPESATDIKSKETEKADLKKEIRTNLLLDIERHPFDGISSRIKRLKISQRKGHQAVEELTDANLINRVEISEFNGKVVLLEIKPSARREMISKGAKHIKPLSERHGGIEHRYWNNKIAEINRGKGYLVSLEEKINGNGYVDQVISKDSLRIAVEIETGKSTPIKTIQKNLELGFDKIICIATNQDVFNRISKQLEKSNLNNNDKVILVKASAYK